MTALLWLLIGLPLAAGAALAVCGRPADRVAPYAAVSVAAVTLADACAVAVGRPRVAARWLDGLPAGLAVDRLSAVLVVTVTAVTLAVLCYAAAEPGRDEARARFFGLMLVFAGAMLVTVTATGLGVLLMGWEVMGATSYALIGFWWREPRRVRAGGVAFLTTRTADLGLYLAAGAALAASSTLDLSRLAGLPSPWLHLAAAGVVAAALGKSAQLPFSFWLSRAMEGPSPVSALLHSATMVAAGAYLLLRLRPLLAATGWAGPTVAWAGAVTALALGLVAVAQRDLKQLLAASTCSQLGYMVLAAGVGGVAGGTAYLVSHAAVKSLLFLGAGALLTALGTKDMRALRGACRRYPWVGATFAVGGLALAGVPPLSLWVAKDELLAAALARTPALYAVGLLAAAVTATYSAKAVLTLLAARTATRGYDTERQDTRRVTGGMVAPLVALAVPAAALGLLAVTGDGGPAAAWWELLASAAVAVAAFAGWPALARRPAPPAVGGWFARWLDLERAADLLVVRPTLALARALAAFDDRGLDAVVRGAAAGTRSLAGLAARVDDRSVDGVVRDLAGGARRLGALARRPQTGQLHQYYAQAIVALAILAIIVLLVR